MDGSSNCQSPRAREPYRARNKVTSPHEGTDRLAAERKDAGDAPLPLPRDYFRGVHGLREHYDLVIVGAGLSGCVIAERAARELGKRSLVIDKRSHVGGNCYDYIDEHGIRVSLYGVHLFHTQFERVWQYVTRFSEWLPYEHRVKARVRREDGRACLIPVPPVQQAVNTLFDANVHSEDEMTAWLDARRPKIDAPANGEEMALSRVGPQLYEAVFKHYTKKQWDKYPSELDASVTARIPCRVNDDDRYFGDAWQALPRRGYTRLFENMLFDNPLVDVRLDLDFFEHRAQLPAHSLLVYTGPIDAFYASQGLPKLEYRSITFKREYHEVAPRDADGERAAGAFFQEALQVNYPGPDVPYTRITEYKHKPNQPDYVRTLPGTVVYKEFSCADGDPYYPVPNPENRALYERYRAMAEQEKGVAFVGRLASYKYFNMDQAILNALEMFDNLVETGKLEPKRSPVDMVADGPK